MNNLLPVLALIGGYSIGGLAIAVVVAVVVLGIVFVVIRQAQIPIPQWVWQILGLMLLGVVAIIAIKFVMSL